MLPGHHRTSARSPFPRFRPRAAQGSTLAGAADRSEPRAGDLPGRCGHSPATASPTMHPAAPSAGGRVARSTPTPWATTSCGWRSARTLRRRPGWPTRRWPSSSSACSARSAAPRRGWQRRPGAAGSGEGFVRSEHLAPCWDHCYARAAGGGGGGPAGGRALKELRPVAGSARPRGNSRSTCCRRRSAPPRWRPSSVGRRPRGTLRDVHVRVPFEQLPQQVNRRDPDAVLSQGYLCLPRVRVRSLQVSPPKPPPARLSLACYPAQRPACSMPA